VSTPPTQPSFGLQPVLPSGDAAELAALEARLTDREAELNALKLELQELQSRHLTEIGPLYRDLAEIEDELADLEIRAGLRPPPEEESGAGAGDVADEESVDAAICEDHGTASHETLKRVFRDLAKNIHPDLAMDDAARLRRHSLMAEANRAYAERDADRLLLILHRWQRSSDAVIGDDDESRELRIRRRRVEVEEQLAAVEAEFIELRNSAIARLKNKIDDTRRQGWDLFAEMVAQVKSDIARAKGRLAATRRMVGVRTDTRLG
jgi:hypothetical protein